MSERKRAYPNIIEIKMLAEQHRKEAAALRHEAEMFEQTASALDQLAKTALQSIKKIEEDFSMGAQH